MPESLRLFLVEDDDDVARQIGASLDRARHHVTRCRRGADAIIVLAHQSFDLVLLDQLLPDRAGLDLLVTLIREGLTAPVLMVTAHGDEDTAARAFQAGALDYIVKDAGGVYLADLPQRVNQAVKRHRLEQLNGLLIQALESARDGIMITDLHGTILKVNQALVSMTGYSREELEGQNPRILKSPAHPPEFFATMWSTILSRNSWQREITNRHKDGSLVPMSMTISPIVDSQGRLTHFVGILRDMAAHKQLERQLLQAQKMQSVGTLAGGVAHEFNNLLAGINGYAALGLREWGLTPPMREFFEHIVTLSERAAILTRQLLAFARKPSIMRQRAVVLDLMGSTVDFVRRTLYIDVTLQAEETARDGSALLVHADANQLQQALVNLALNARDALLERGNRSPGAAVKDAGSQKEGLIFRLRQDVVTTEQVGFPLHVPPGDYVLLEVEDHGCGMSPEVLNQALDPFFTTKEVGQGTGLGLPMVFGIVQGHQGFMTIDSTLREGTCVRLYLPRLLPSPPRPLAVPSTPEVVQPLRVPRRALLVIDDEEPVLDVVRRFLQIAGHDVVSATSGHEGLKHLRAGKRVDLVILDLMMPRENATDTFEALRQCQPKVPVLLCTGLPQAEPAPDLLQRPGVTMLRKPFRMNELWYAVNQALSRADA